jgi:hypothetical protein
MKMVVLAYQAMKINGSRDGSVFIDNSSILITLMELVLQ